MFIKHYNITQEQKDLISQVTEICEKHIKPYSMKWDEEQSFPRDAIKILGDRGFFGIPIPKEYGGMGRKVKDFILVMEEIARYDASFAAIFGGSLLGTIPILLGGTEQQKKKYLTRIAKGEALAAFGLTEPDAGSDAASITTSAKKQGDFYILNGKKHFITNAGEADIYTIWTKTRPDAGIRGISGFIVEKDTPGMEFGQKFNKMGIRASTTGAFTFKDAKVPAENLLGGREGTGFATMMRTFYYSRPGVAAQAVGIAQGAYELAVRRTKKRKQFGQTIASFQGVQWMLVDMATKIEAARSLVYNVVDMVDNGEKDLSAAASMAKYYASDVAMEVTTDAVQVCGGWGYMKGIMAEKFMRDAKITQIYEGPNEIQKNIVALGILRMN
jgi:alkylation response protein AidB-like acyl-CoA dehydrogenase